MDDYQRYIAYSRYARWLDSHGRRETWDETVHRYVQFWVERDKLSRDEAEDLEQAITNLDVMPSMRALMTAGPALARENIAGYNCAYVTADSTKVFAEILYVLMCGTGVGFSVESQYVSKLPPVPSEHSGESQLWVADSKLGWAEAYNRLINGLYDGLTVHWDLSKIRPAGARLKTFGGRASGPEPLNDLFEYTVALFNRARGRRLSTVEVHDLICKIASSVVVGGVRRSALISLSDLADANMSRAKTGEWYLFNPERALANNSATYSSRPSMSEFLSEWSGLFESKSGERGIFNRDSCIRKAEGIGRYPDPHFGTNPCSEIILRPMQLCNLTEVVVRPGDTLEQLRSKVAKATLLGTLQSTLTEFKFVRAKWKQNCDEERLLGVSLTGTRDHEVLGEVSQPARSWLNELRKTARTTNEVIASRLGIPTSAAITCVKPSGTVSQLVNCASGIHERYAPYYIRRVISDIKDPIASLLIDQGIPYERSLYNPDGQVVFSFPIQAPTTRTGRSAVDQLEYWKMFADAWCDHKPSFSVYYTEQEYMETGAWVYNNFDLLSGVSFFPKADHIYKQAPYQEITKEEYEAKKAAMPTIQWDKLASYEKVDYTTSSQEYACQGGACEL